MLTAVAVALVVGLAGRCSGSSSLLNLPGFFQKHNILPFHSARILPPDSEHPHLTDRVVLLGDSRTPSGATMQTAVDLSTGRVIADFRVSLDKTAAAQSSRKFVVEADAVRSADSAWRVALGAQEQLVQISEAAIQTEAFPAKTSAEGKAAWKFLHKNSVCILSESPQGSSLRVVQSEEGAMVGNFFFEHLAQGKMLYRENFVVVHGWNRKFLRHELYLVNLYRNTEISLWELVRGNFKKSEHAVRSEIRRFVFPHGDVKHMEISKTRNSLAPVTIIFALEDGRVVRKLLPEISDHPTAAQGGVVDFDGVEVLTRGNFIGEISMLVTGPTMLESTSAVVVIGNSGIAISRVASPLAFDSLGSFDREMLATSLAVVGLIFVASEILARRATRLRKWK